MNYISITYNNQSCCLPWSTCLSALLIPLSLLSGSSKASTAEAQQPPLVDTAKNPDGQQEGLRQQPSCVAPAQAPWSTVCSRALSLSQSCRTAIAPRGSVSSQSCHTVMLTDSMFTCLQGNFTRTTIMGDPDKIAKVYWVNWSRDSSNPDHRYRSREHWQAVTVSIVICRCPLLQCSFEKCTFLPCSPLMCKCQLDSLK